MMRIIKYFCVFSVVAAISSCEENEIVIPFTESDNLLTFPTYPSLGASFTEIDPVVVPINVGGSVTSVEVRSEDGSMNFGSVAISSGEGSFETSLSELGITVAGSSADLRFVVTEASGDEVRYPFTVSTTDPIALTAPEGVVQNGEAYFFNFEADAAIADISDVSVLQKVGAAGIYAPVAGEFTTSDSVGIVGANYMVGDSVFTQVSITGNGLTSTAEAFTVVGAYTFANESEEEIQLDNASPAYDLVAASDTIVGAPTADIEFTLGPLNLVGFQSGNGTTFVPVDEEDANDVYAAGNQVAIEALYEAGTPVSEVIDVEEDDTFVYRTMRGEEAIYGIIRITDVERTNDDDSDSLAFTYKY